MPSTVLYENWLKIPIDIYMTFYVFNLTNPEEFEKNGTKPVFVELGPFVYKEIRTRENITHNPNETITFSERRIFHFVRNMSAYDESVEVTTLNLMTITALNFVRYRPEIERRALNYAFKLTGESLVMKIQAGQLLFGYNDKLLDLLLKIYKKALPTTQISLFYNVSIRFILF